MNKNLASLLSVLILVVCFSIGVSSQTSAFTYQGKLTDSSVPANGTYPTRFDLFAAATGGGAIASQTPNVTVINGIFTVTLDFGANAFDGNPRYLEITVGSTTLTPRQPITSAPYAIRSSKAAVADDALLLNGVAGSQYVLTADARLSDARPPTPGSASYIQNGTALQLSSNFNITGSGVASIFDATTQYNINGNRVLSVTGAGSSVNSNTFTGVGAGAANIPNGSNPTGNTNSFYGNNAGTANTTGFQNSFFGYLAGAANIGASNNSYFGFKAGQNNSASAGANSFFGSVAGQNNTGNSNSFFGFGAGFNNVAGTNNTFIGISADFNISNPNGDFNILLGANARVNSGVSNSTAIGRNSLVTQSNSLILGGITGFNNGTDTNVGIGTTAPLGRLQVVTANDTAPATIAAWDARHFVIGGTGSTGGIGISYDQTNNVGYLEALSPNVAFRNLVLQSGGGNIGIGTLSPDRKLSVNGDASKAGGGSWQVYSDERLKNIKGRFTPGLAAVMRLQPILYRYKTENAMGIKSEGEHVGFSAQEVEKVIPEAVTKNDQGYRMVNNDPIMWAMLNAVQEQQRQIEAQKLTDKKQQAVIDDQQKQIDAQMKLIEALKGALCSRDPGAEVCKLKN